MRSPAVHARRRVTPAEYEELYAAYRYAARVLDEARVSGASVPTLRRMRERADLLRALLAAWRKPA